LYDTQIDYEAELEGGPRIVSHVAEANPDKTDTFVLLDVRLQDEFREVRGSQSTVRFETIRCKPSSLSKTIRC
jgi:hypothetical protein